MNDGKIKTQPARPFSEGIAHPFSPTMNQINDGKMKTQSAQPPNGLFDK
jgi:hypothetical protein